MIDTKRWRESAAFADGEGRSFGGGGVKTSILIITLAILSGCSSLESTGDFSRFCPQQSNSLNNGHTFYHEFKIEYDSLQEPTAVCGLCGWRMKINHEEPK